MAIQVNEKKMVDDSIYQFEDRLKSPTSRFIDINPNFVTYYHINNEISTTDEGFSDIASIIGFRSPLRFQKIENFPLYDIDQVVLQIQDSDQGLDTTYEGDGIILPGTIKPLENDFFIIPYLHDFYLFRITEISYDNVTPDNFYKIGFKLEYIDEEKVNQINTQVNDEYTCLLENIGTENKCIINSKDLIRVQKIDGMYNDMANTYLALFYNKQHNCLLGTMEFDKFLYDPLQNEFINKHLLFNKKNNLDTLIFTDQFTDPKRRIKYENSIWRFIEKQDYKNANNFSFICYTGTSQIESSFSRWYDKSVYISDVPEKNLSVGVKIISDEFALSIRTNGFVEKEYEKLIQKYVRREELSINDVSFNLMDEFIEMNGSLECFFFTPIILYIIKEIVKKEI